MSGLDIEAIRRRLDWLRACEEQCQVSPGQVSLHGYAAAAIDCGRDVPALLAQLDREQAALAEALATVREQAAEIAYLQNELDEEKAVGTRLRTELNDARFGLIGERDDALQVIADLRGETT